MWILLNKNRLIPSVERIYIKVMLINIRRVVIGMGINPKRVPIGVYGRSNVLIKTSIDMMSK